MLSVEKYLEELRYQLGTAEIAAAIDLVRMDKEHKAKKDERWAKMIEETRVLRALCDQLTYELAEGFSKLLENSSDA